MTNLDEQITNMLHRHAADTPIEDNLDVVLSDGHLVRFASGRDEPPRPKSQFLVAAAAAVIVAVGAVGIVQFSRSDDSPASSASDEAPMTPPSGEASSPTPSRRFPVHGPVSEITANIGGTFVFQVEPYATRAILARREVDRIVDVASIDAAVTGPGDDTQLVPPDAQITTGTLGDLAVMVYDNAGGRWYRWTDGQVTVLLQSSKDSEAIANSLSVSVNASTGLADLAFGALPSGLKTITSPQPLTGTQPALSTDDGQFDLFITTAPTLVDSSTVDAYDIVDINGNEGFATALGEGSMVTWRADGDTWMRLSASAIEVDRLIQIARDTTYVDQSAWERIYNTDFPTSPVTPSTTEP